jgi:hypothetical protein
MEGVAVYGSRVFLVYEADPAAVRVLFLRAIVN